MQPVEGELRPVVVLDDICVRYQVPDERIGSFKEYVIRALQNKVRTHEFLALNGIDMVINKGETFGIIGPNGAGKSTLLKVISKVLAPINGRVRIYGKVAPLLELGAGFHPELTGRENITLNGTLLGHSQREIRLRQDEILDFAQIGEFVDAPLRTFSSGMVARLGFAVATSWEPDILILDEILAVGDEAFRAKCLKRLKIYQARGMTTILVTHDMDQILSSCERAVLLDHGKIVTSGEATEVVPAYRELLQRKECVPQ